MPVTLRKALVGVRAVAARVAVVKVSVPILVSVENTGSEMVDICARADQKKDHEQEGLEVEERRLRDGRLVKGDDAGYAIAYTMLSDGPRPYRSKAKSVGGVECLW